ncbi:MAG: MFS transporter [Rhodospirillales bacterium]|nr:MFS transporter [Rhodospirillales bacterium]HIJ43424.1 MFS transporter [Rhodospirillaceae bacterium]MDP7099242.1 MFS transporter [Rhodospirillales bacterium]MDP7215544.1 MFS transporter [Rhodospirillales bacterium]HIJ93702.1 MFS transporter [Rhodospirillaceae bacterium]
MKYLLFVLDNRRFLAFGLLLVFCSSFGQTYFISLFGNHIRTEFALSHGDFGILYSLATLGSAITMVWAGRLIDTIDLRVFSLSISAALAGASFFMASASSTVFLVIALYTLRLAGQGLMGHASATSMARYFEHQRGKAMSVAALGYPLGEAVMPLTAVVLVGAIGWRETWLAIGTAMALLLAPMVLWLLKGHGQRHHRLGERSRQGNQVFRQRQWTRREVLGDRRFYLVLPAVLAPPFILTGLFFHQIHLASTKGWSLAWLASCFIGYAAATVISSLFSGQLVDRLGASRLLPFYLLPLALALLALAVSNHPGVALFYMVTAGMTSGASFTVVGAMWAEVYGVAHLGAIRALASALMVFSTALSPAALGWMIDHGVSMEAIAWMFLAYIGGATALAVISGLPSDRMENYRRRP